MKQPCWFFEMELIGITALRMPECTEGGVPFCISDFEVARAIRPAGKGLINRRHTNIDIKPVTIPVTSRGEPVMRDPHLTGNPLLPWELSFKMAYITKSEEDGERLRKLLDGIGIYEGLRWADFTVNVLSAKPAEVDIGDFPP